MQKNKWFLPMIASLFIGFSLASSFPDDAVVYAKEKKPIVICIDPGHGGVGGRNLGAQYNGISEKEVTLITATAMKNELEKYEGIQVYMTRTTDTEVSLDARAAYAKAVGADFLFSIHYNASPSHTIYGSEIWISAFGNNYKRNPWGFTKGESRPDFLPREWIIMAFSAPPPLWVFQVASSNMLIWIIR